MYNYILFDLDGTLTDPGVGITKSVQYALRAFGITVEDRRVLECFIGPPLADSFREYYGFSAAEAQRAVEEYRAYYSTTGLYENEVYPGIPALLQALGNAGKTLVLATSKPWVFAEQILSHFSLSNHFAFIGGSELDGSRVKKGEVIDYVLRNHPCADLSHAVMVGDRKHDIIGAKENELTAIGVLFGYGSRAELEDAGADSVAADVAELSRLLLGSV